MADLETLKIKIIDDSSSSVQPLEKLSSALVTLKKSTSGGVSGLKKQAAGIDSLAVSINKINSSSLLKLKLLSDGIQNLQSISNVKLSSALPKNITNLSTSLNSIPPDATAKLATIASALTPLTTLGKSNLGPFVSQLNKLPEAINKIDLQKLSSQISSLTQILKPFADEMAKITAGFDKFPTRIQNLIKSTEKYNSTIIKSSKKNNSFASSFAGIVAKVYLLQRAFNSIGSLVNKSNEYQESLNLFTASMGEYADTAFEYGQKVSEIMGIDISDWIYNQGIFMTLSTGFGVAGDSAAKMSEQLTQLGYDLSSFYNMSVEDAMLKLQSGLSGELEPLRRLGYDLSQARLEQEALNLGIEKSVSDMNQAEKAQLRYVAIMTQVTQVQGDMARTLESPANQLRILQAQLEMTGRSIGNIFIPALNAILPYAIAVVQVFREIADAIASFFDFKLTEVDYSGIGTVVGDAEDLTGELDGVNEELAKMQSYTLGFDELNVLNDTSSSSQSTDLGAGFDFDASKYEYNFLADAINENVESIKEKLKPFVDWFKENLDDIVKLVKVIGIGLLAWKLSTTFTNGLKLLSAFSKGGALSGISLAFTGFVLEFDGLKEIFENGINGINLGESIIGAIFGATGTAMFTKGLLNWLTTSFASEKVLFAIANFGTKLGFTTSEALFGALGTFGGSLLAGIPLLIVGLYDALKRGISWMSASLITFATGLIGFGISAIVATITAPVAIAVGAVVGIITSLGILIYQNWDSIKTYVTEFIDEIKFNASETWRGIVEDSRTLVNNIKKTWNGVASWFSETIAIPIQESFTKAMDAVRNVINDIINWINDKLHFDFDGLTVLGQEIIPAFSFQLFTLPQIPAFEDGGFPTVGEMFIANEAGPEMIGKMGSNTTVANNDQIAQGFASQIYPAMYNAVSDAMSKSGGEIVVNVVAELDGQVVYKNQEKVKRERGRNIGMGVFAR